MGRKKRLNVFETLDMYGHDIDFEGQPSEMFFPTMFGPGSKEKQDVLRQRLELGLPLWHPDDNPICSEARMGGSKGRVGATYGKTATFFATKLNKTLSE